MKVLVEKIESMNLGKIRLCEQMSKHTTLRIGGLVDIFFIPHDIRSLKQSIEMFKQLDIPWKFIGNGSNVVIKDGGVRGVVIKLPENISNTEFSDHSISVSGGFSLTKLSILASKASMSGLEFACGIPGTIGGAIYMNAGGYGSEMSDVVNYIHVLDENGEMHSMHRDELNFGPRKSILQGKKWVVYQANLKLIEGNKESSIKRMKKFMNHRKQTQPYGIPSVGSVFLNPPNEYSGQIIEASGLKGYRMGDAQVSEIHANHFVNKGQATASDFLKLMEHVKKVIADKYNINLIPEVEILGENL
ncbi:UDP-N-acetylenolpyruvoylglucosamine reductase [Paenibacillus sp. LC231]|nr:UDP-N-acetylenolpyruvoylglucosamine reductase [Paenibacillus sp. LC231]